MSIIDDQRNRLWHLGWSFGLNLAQDHHRNLVPTQLRFCQRARLELRRQDGAEVVAQELERNTCLGFDAEADLPVDNGGISHKLITLSASAISSGATRRCLP